MARLILRSEDSPAEIIDLKGGTNRFGRSAENDFQVEHPTVSRFHCEVMIGVEGMFVRDLDSSNGTFIDDEPVERLSPLRQGQVLRIGDIRLEVKDAPKPAPEAGVTPCENHPKIPASMKCQQCGKVFCGSCIHVLKRLNGEFLKLCPVCSGYCEPLEGMNKGIKPKAKFGAIMDKWFKKKTMVTKFRAKRHD